MIHTTYAREERERVFFFYARIHKYHISSLTLPPPPPPHYKTTSAVAVTGIIWSRYSTQITPVNYNLLAVNAVMAVTGVWHLVRIYQHQANQKTPTTA